MIPFGEWLPDLPALGNPGATVARNVVPVASHYEPWKALVAFTNSLRARCRGAAAAKDGSGNVLVFAGDASDLYRLADDSWTQVSKGGAGAYGTGELERWAFALYSDVLVASNFDDPIQGWTLGSSSAWADLAASAPRARHIATVRSFLVAANTWDAGDGEVRNRVWWSPFNNPSGDWTPSVATQADFEDLPSGGPVQGIVGGEVGLVLCESAIYRMSYIGPPAIFELDEVEPNRGCAAPGSIATDGRRTVYLAENGFYMTDGRDSLPIGANKIDGFFLSDAAPDCYHLMNAAIDPARKLYVLSYVGKDAAGGSPNRLLLYNWQVGRWSLVEQGVQQLARLMTPGYTLESLDDIQGDLEQFPASLDSRAFAGGALIFGGFDDTSRLGLFGGAPLGATIETGELQLHAPRRARVLGVRPLVEAAGTAPGLAVQVGRRDLQDVAVAWSAALAPHAETGLAPFRSEGRYHRARVSIGGDWKKALGIDAESVPAGTR